VRVDHAQLDNFGRHAALGLGDIAARQHGRTGTDREFSAIECHPFNSRHTNYIGFKVNAAENNKLIFDIFKPT
jgi:hypothetical protein